MSHRRNRHLNPASAGATMVLDARFITGASNNTTVQTWNSRPIATISASQSTSGSRALYLDSTINGMPGMVFDGSDDYYEVSDLSMTANKSAMWSLVVGVCSTIGDAIQYGLFTSSGTASGGNRFSQRLADASNQRFTASLRRLDADSNVVTSTAGATTSPMVGIVSSDFTNNVGSSSRNGGTATTVAYSSGGGSGPTTNALVSRIGAVTNISGRLNGKLGQVLFMPTLPSASLAKRLRHCAAFSFKIISQ